MRRRQESISDLSVHAEVRGITPLYSLDEVSEIFGLAPSTVRSKTQRGEFRPAPYAKYPYRWRKVDIERELAAPAVDSRYAKHGFATTRRKLVPARARLRSKKAAGE